MRRHGSNSTRFLTARRPGQTAFREPRKNPQRHNVDFPSWVVEALDREANALASWRLLRGAWRPRRGIRRRGAAAVKQGMQLPLVLRLTPQLRRRRAVNESELLIILVLDLPEIGYALIGHRRPRGDARRRRWRRPGDLD